MIPETSYGVRKKLDYILKQIRDLDKKNLRIMDFGCGTGHYITIPVAKDNPDSEVVGVDRDERSLAFGDAKKKELGLDNLQFTKEELTDFKNGSFDVIICSDVLEHVTTYKKMLDEFSRILKPNGILIISIPNGKGPYEIANYLYKRRMNVLLQIPFKAISAIKNVIRTDPKNTEIPVSFDDEGHVNFFSLGGFKKDAKESGFHYAGHWNGVFLCGPGLSGFVDPFKFMIAANSKAADILPSRMATNWFITFYKK